MPGKASTKTNNKTPHYVINIIINFIILSTTNNKHLIKYLKIQSSNTPKQISPTNFKILTNNSHKSQKLGSKPTKHPNKTTSQSITNGINKKPQVQRAPQEDQITPQQANSTQQNHLKYNLYIRFVII